MTICRIAVSSYAHSKGVYNKTLRGWISFFLLEMKVKNSIELGDPTTLIIEWFLDFSGKFSSINHPARKAADWLDLCQIEMRCVSGKTDYLGGNADSSYKLTFISLHSSALTVMLSLLRRYFLQYPPYLDTCSFLDKWPLGWKLLILAWKETFCTVWWVSIGIVKCSSLIQKSPWVSTYSTADRDNVRAGH